MCKKSEIEMLPANEGDCILITIEKEDIHILIYGGTAETYRNCIFRKNCASVPEERSAIPLQTEQSLAGLLVTVVYSTILARKFKTICLGCHSA